MTPRRRIAFPVLLAVATLAAVFAGSEILVRRLWSPFHPADPLARTGFDPELGLVHVTGHHRLTFRRCLPGLGCSDVAVRFTISDHGARGDRDFRSPSGRPLVVVLGDSMIEAAQVDDEKTACHLLERGLARDWPGVEVRNLGITSAGLIHYYVRWQRLVKEMQPDVLVVAVLGLNDFRNSSPTLETFAPMRPHYDRSAGEIAVHFERDPARNRRTHLESIRLLEWLWAVRQEAPDGFFSDARIHEVPADPEVEQAIRLGLDQLQRLIRQARQAGVRVLVVYLPWKGEVFDQDWASLARAYARTSRGGRLVRDRAEILVEDAATGDGAAFVSFREAVLTSRDVPVAELWHSQVDGHLTEAGNRVLAGVLERSVGGVLSDFARPEFPPH